MSNMMPVSGPENRLPRLPEPQNRVAQVVTQAAAGALVTIIAVFALSTLLHLVEIAVISAAVVIALGAILWYAFLRKR
jgi:hypothetical protein